MDGMGWTDALSVVRTDCVNLGRWMPDDEFGHACRIMAHEIGPGAGTDFLPNLELLIAKGLRFAAAWLLVPQDWNIELRRERNGVCAAAVVMPCQQKSAPVFTSDVATAILAALATAILVGPDSFESDEGEPRHANP